MRIIPEEEIDPEDARVICYRVADLPAPHAPSRMEICCECPAPVWRAESSPQGPKAMCLQCAGISQDGTEEYVITPRQAEIIKRRNRH